MLPFVPRSVAGTKRVHPKGAPPPQAPQGASGTPTRDVRPLAASLLNVLSAWWAQHGTCGTGHGARDLAALVSEATAQDIHVARLLANSVLARLGCTSSANMCAALAHLYPFHAVQQGRDAFHVRFAPAQDTRAVFVECILDQPGDALHVAECVLRLVHAVKRAHPVQVYAAYPPSIGGEPSLPTALMRDAIVVVDATSADILIHKWDWTYSERPFGSSVRCMPLKRFQDMCIEYEAWRQELVRQNIQAAKTKAAAPMCVPLAPVDYPLATIVALPHAGPANVIKAQLSVCAPNAIDYVDVQQNKTTAYVRCASADAAAKVAAHVGSGAHVLSGEAQAAYWAQVPQRVRNAAYRRSLK